MGKIKTSFMCHFSLWLTLKEYSRKITIYRHNKSKLQSPSGRDTTYCIIKHLKKYTQFFFSAMADYSGSRLAVWAGGLS